MCLGRKCKFMSNLNHFTIKIRDRDNGKEITSDLSHVLLTGNNPRYKIISDKNINLIQFLKACDKTQEEILKDLLDCEGDFSDFKRLIESINENGFIDRRRRGNGNRLRPYAFR